MPTFRELRERGGRLLETLRTLRRTPCRRWRSIHYATGSSLVLLFAVLVPRYMQAMLEVSPDKAVTIFAPVGVGAIVGLRALPYIAARLGKNRTVIVGLCGLALCVIALGLDRADRALAEATEHLNPFEEQRAAGSRSWCC